MASTASATESIIKTYQRAKNDTGSPEVQIALWTARIVSLTQHMKSHPHDVHTRYGLTNLVSQRRRMMIYLKRTNAAVYRSLLEQLEVRG